MTTHIRCQAERNFSALAHLIGDLRSNMLASKVERMMFIRLNRHLVKTVHELDAANAQARARVAKSCLLYTSPSPRDGLLSRMPSSA